MTARRTILAAAIPRGARRPRGRIGLDAWLPFVPPDRWEVGLAASYYRDAQGPVERLTYAHCFDLSWPWWRPWAEET